MLSDLANQQVRALGRLFSETELLCKCWKWTCLIYDGGCGLKHVDVGRHPIQMTSQEYYLSILKKITGISNRNSQNFLNWLVKTDSSSLQGSSKIF